MAASPKPLLKTQSFSLTRPLYFRIIATSYYRRRWMLYVGFPVFLAAIAIFQPIDNVYLMVGIGLIALFALLLPLMQFWLFSGRASNQHLYQPHSLALFPDEIVMVSEEGRQRKMPYSQLRKASQAEDHYLLSFEGNAFLYVPYTAFANNKQREKFEKLIQRKGS
jgi:hypothetical protein